MPAHAAEHVDLSIDDPSDVPNSRLRNISFSLDLLIRPAVQVNHMHMSIDRFPRIDLAGMSATADYRPSKHVDLPAVQVRLVIDKRD